MPGIAARRRIEAPATTPRPYSLLTAVPVLPMSDPHDENGLTWDPAPCSPADTWAIQCEPSAEDKLANADLYGDTVETDPLVVYGAAACSFAGGVDLEELEEAARARLIAGEAFAVERAFMTDSPDLGRSLQSAVDVTPASGALPMVGGIATLEAHLAENALSRGVIHVPPAAAPYLNALRQVEAVGSRLQVPLTGTAVAVGAGYAANMGPDGTTAPAGEAWIYATGPMTIHRSEIFSSSGRDLRRNDLGAIAERAYSIGYECGAWAVRVSMRCCGCE